MPQARWRQLESASAAQRLCRWLDGGRANEARRRPIGQELRQAGRSRATVPRPPRPHAGRRARRQAHHVAEEKRARTTTRLVGKNFCGNGVVPSTNFFPSPNTPTAPSPPWRGHVRVTSRLGCVHTAVAPSSEGEKDINGADPAQAQPSGDATPAQQPAAAHIPQIRATSKSTGRHPHERLPRARRCSERSATP